MKRALILIPLCVIIAMIDAPILQHEKLVDAQPEKLIADYVYIYEYDGRLKTSCRRGEYVQPAIGEWYALENETYVITNYKHVWCDGMPLNEVTISIYCESIKKYLTK